MPEVIPTILDISEYFRLRLPPIRRASHRLSIRPSSSYLI